MNKQEIKLREVNGIKFISHNDNEIEIGGTSRIYQVQDIAYSTLKKLFGKPLDGDGYKVDAQWIVEIEDGTIITIYNYKTGKNYLGHNGIPKTKITTWNIGGYSEKVIAYIDGILR